MCIWIVLQFHYKYLSFSRCSSPSLSLCSILYQTEALSLSLFCLCQSVASFSTLLCSLCWILCFFAAAAAVKSHLSFNSVPGLQFADQNNKSSPTKAATPTVSKIDSITWKLRNRKKYKLTRYSLRAQAGQTVNVRRIVEVSSSCPSNMGAIF